MWSRSKVLQNCENCPISRDFAEGWFVCSLSRTGLAPIDFEPRDLMVRARRIFGGAMKASSTNNNTDLEDEHYIVYLHSRF